MHHQQIVVMKTSFTELDKFPVTQDILNCKNYAGCNKLKMLELWYIHSFVRK
jgi:hypothetical protein